MKIVSLFCFLFYISIVYAYIPAPVNIMDPRIKLNLKLTAGSAITFNDSIYVYGGAISKQIQNVSNTLYQYKLNEKTFRFDLFMVNTTNAGPQCLYCQPVMLPGTSQMLIIGSDWANNSDNYMAPYLFDFETLTWTNKGPSAVYNGGFRGRNVFETRLDHIVQMASDGNVYVFGGTNALFTGLSTCFRSSFYYTPSTNTFTAVPADSDRCIVSGSAFVVPEYPDDILFLFGLLDDGVVYQTDNNNSYGYVDSSNYQTNLTSNNYLYSYKISTGLWGTYPLNGPAPGPRYAATVQYNPETKLLHGFGGAKQYEGSTFDIYGDVVTLNMTSLTWYPPSFPGGDSRLAEGRIDAASTILKNKYLVTFYGQTIELSYPNSLTEIDIFEFPATISGADYPMTIRSASLKQPSSKVSILTWPKLNQFGVVVGVVAGIFLLWIIIIYISEFCGNIDSGTEVIVKTFYDRRIGEPVWTEVARCIVKILAFIIFVLYIIYCYDNNANSTISSTSTFDTQDNITYPDVRFCFTQWNTSIPIVNNSVIQCTVKGQSYVDLADCNKYIYHLDREAQSPTFDYSDNGFQQCWFFKSDSSSIAATEENPTLSFKINLDPTYLTNESMIYVNAYDVKQDPNRYVFFNEPIPTDWDQEELDKWAQVGDNSVQDIDKFSYMNFNDSIAIGFETKTYQNLNPKGAWNYIGSLFPSYIVTENFTATYTHRAKVPDGTVIVLAPVSFDKETVTYKRDNTVLGAIATAGGILGLMTTVIVLMFGNRPFGPWGWVHIGFRRHHEQLLSDTLDRRLFKKKHYANGLDEETAYVPLATPVESRFIHAFNEINLSKYSHDPLQMISERDDLRERLLRLEARNQMMELVLKAYYVDDYIFHTLNHQRETNPAIGRSLSSHDNIRSQDRSSPDSSIQNAPLDEAVKFGVVQEKENAKSRFQFINKFKFK